MNFDGPIDVATLAASTDISVVTPGRDRKFNTRDDLKSRVRGVSYDPATRSVLLKLGKFNTKGGNYRVRMNGVTDTFGRPLDVDDDGVAGGLFVKLSGTKAKRL